MRTHRTIFRAAAPNPRRGAWIIPFLLVGVATVAHSQYRPEPGVEVLTRGPVHEAFAEASVSSYTAGVVVTRYPHDPIQELPPDQRPDGYDVAWIPGYWSWDYDRNDFIWVSGVWRDIPPGRQWVPGYWSPVGSGSQWISGFWSVAAQREVTYLPPPPAPLDYGPSSSPQYSNSQWSPGGWVWQYDRYYWQPGYWTVQHPNWVWTPAYYSWTPRGYVYVPGYWDYDFARRGVMFAPVYYNQPVYSQPAYYHSPSIVIDIAVIFSSLFIHTSSRQYYYGDYYDPRYVDQGYQPWYSQQASPYGYDPMYAHYRTSQLQYNPNWDTYIDQQYAYRRAHVEARPQQTLALQFTYVQNRSADAPANLVIGRTLEDVVKSDTSPHRFKRVEMEERKQYETRGREVHTLQAERATVERAESTPTAKAETAIETGKPVRLQLRESPVAARRTERVEGAGAPPAAPVVPEVRDSAGQRRESMPEQSQRRTGTPGVRGTKETKAPETAPTAAKPAPTPSRGTETDRGEDAESESTQPKPATTELESDSGRPDTGRSDARETESTQSEPLPVESNETTRRTETERGEDMAPERTQPEPAVTQPTSESRRPDTGRPDAREMESPQSEPVSSESPSQSRTTETRRQDVVAAPEETAPAAATTAPASESRRNEGGRPDARTSESVETAPEPTDRSSRSGRTEEPAAVEPGSEGAATETGESGRLSDTESDEDEDADTEDEETRDSARGGEESERRKHGKN